MKTFLLESTEADLILFAGDSSYEWWWNVGRGKILAASYCPDNSPALTVMVETCRYFERQLVQLLTEGWEVRECNDEARAALHLDEYKRYRVEYDLKYHGGDYTDVGNFEDVIVKDEKDIKRAFKKRYNISARHIISYWEVELIPDEDTEDEPWYWLMESEIDTEEFGPYDTEEEAIAGTRRVQAETRKLADGIKRRYSAPYQGTGNSDGAEEEDETTLDHLMAAARKKGREAATLGLTPEHCPYPMTTEAAAHWLSGFSQAQSLQEEWTP